MSAVRLCKDCRHVRDLGERHPMCGHPNAPASPVDGSPTAPCLNLRENFLQSFCGPDATGFEPIHSMLDKPEWMASATLSSELESMQAAKSAVQACNMAETSTGLALANPSPKRSSIEATALPRYESAVIDACRIKVSASTVILVLPCGSVILSAPQGYGKKEICEPLGRLFECHGVVVEWNFSKPLITGALHLTNDVIWEGGAA